MILILIRYLIHRHHEYREFINQLDKLFFFWKLNGSIQQEEINIIYLKMHFKYSSIIFYCVGVIRQRIRSEFSYFMNMNQYQYDIEIVNTQIIFPNFRRLDMLDLLFENQHTQYNAPPKIRKKRFLATPSHLTLITLNLSDNCESLNEEVKHQSRMKLQPILIIRFLEQKLEELF